MSPDTDAPPSRGGATPQTLAAHGSGVPRLVDDRRAGSFRLWAPAGWVRFAIAATIVALMAYPTVWMILSALKTNREFFRFPLALPVEWHLSNFAQAWQTGGMGSLYMNSLLVTLGSAMITVLSATAAAFAFSRLEFPGRRLFYRMFLVGLVLPAAAVVIALFVQLREMTLLNTLWALILPNAAWGMSLSIFLLKAYFDTLPTDIEEAARMDGANLLQIFWTISVPMVWPAMLTVIILSTLGAWNELLFAMVFISDQDSRTLPAGLIRFSTQYSTDYVMVMAALTMLTLPVLLFYFLLQKRMIAGLTATAMD